MPDNHDISAPEARRYLGSILLVGGLLRVVLWLWFAGSPPVIGDEHDYDTLAVNLVRHGGFAFSPGIPISLRPPLYPATVAAVYGLFGLENFQAVRLLQAGLSLLNVLLLYRFGTVVSSRRVGLWLAGWYGFYPSMLGFNNLLLTEVLFTFLLCSVCHALVQALRRESFVHLGLAGVLLGLAALTRSVLWLFPIVLGAFLLWAWKGHLPRRLLAVGTLIVAFAATVAPWAIRNTRLEETFQVIDCMGGRNFMMGNYEYTPLFRAWDAISEDGERSWSHVLASNEPPSLGATQGQRDKLALRCGVRFVWSHPRLTVKRDVIKFFNFWGLERELVAGVARGYFGVRSTLVLLLLTLMIFGSYCAALISGIFGAIMVPPADRRIHWLLLSVIGFICAMHTVTFGHSRYHLPVMPLILLYSASAVVHSRAIWRRRSERSFRLACGLSAIMILGWLWEIVFIDLQRYLEALQTIA